MRSAQLVDKEKLKELIEFIERQTQVYKELQGYPETWDEVLDADGGETKEDWLFCELDILFTMIREIL